MIINFNIDKLNILLYDFYNVTGLTISIWDSNFNQLAFQPSDMPTFCKLIKSTTAGNHRCFLSDKKICTRSLVTNEAQTHICHAGLVDTAIPIKFHNETLGYMMFGQARPDEDESTVKKRIKRLSAELKLDETTLHLSHKKLKDYQPDLVKSAANILKMATRYLWLADMIKIDNDDLAVKLEEYISANLEQKISIEDLCRNFSISKNKLYSFVKDRFNMTIGNYILKIRIDRAKNLLTTTDMPIYELCCKVGIPEYNYFSKIFKQQAGIPPLKYRKNFPFVLTEKK